MHEAHGLQLTCGERISQCELATWNPVPDTSYRDVDSSELQASECSRSAIGESSELSPTFFREKLFGVFEILNDLRSFGHCPSLACSQSPAKHQPVRV